MGPRNSSKTEVNIFMLISVFELFLGPIGIDANYVIGNEAPDDPTSLWCFVSNDIMGVDTDGAQEQLKNRN